MYPFFCSSSLWLQLLSCSWLCEPPAVLHLVVDFCMDHSGALLPIVMRQASGQLEVLFVDHSTPKSVTALTGQTYFRIPGSMSFALGHELRSVDDKCSNCNFQENSPDRTPLRSSGCSQSASAELRAGGVHQIQIWRALCVSLKRKVIRCHRLIKETKCKRMALTF